ncbi:hypothetical protein [Embleya sp. NPDC059237]|uniref:hypothetical protein n=1 Tax=Embleya sp. NPDC059237 TaxID=3346784 RepID=UPI0036BDF13C
MGLMLAWTVRDASAEVSVDGTVTVTLPGTLQPSVLRAMDGVAYAHALVEHHALQADLLGVGDPFTQVLDDAHTSLYAALDAVRRVAMATATPDPVAAGPAGLEVPPVPAVPLPVAGERVAGSLRLGPFVPPTDPFSRS